MQIRQKTIKKVSDFLMIDVSVQFGIKETNAAFEGKSVFTVRDNKGDRVGIRSIYSEGADVLDYHIKSYQMVLEDD